MSAQTFKRVHKKQGRTVGSGSTSIVVVCRHTKRSQKSGTILVGIAWGFAWICNRHTAQGSCSQHHIINGKEVMQLERVLLLLFEVPPFPLLLLSVKHTQP